MKTATLQGRQSKVRVAYLVANCALGGKERVVRDLADRALRHGTEVLIVTFDPPGSMTEFDVSGHRRVFLDRRMPAAEFGSKLEMALTARRIDVLHVHGHVAMALAARLAGRLPILATMHLSLGRDWIWAIQILRSLRAADRLTAVSQNLADSYSRLTRRPITVVPPGVDVAHFRSSLDLNPSGCLRVGMAARLHPVKRHVDAIEAVRILVSLGLPVTLSIAGEGPMLAELQRQARGLPVTFLGPVLDMQCFYRSIDAFLLCSDDEGTPLALLEAMASGLPCIVSEVGGIPDVVRMESGIQCALVVPKRNPRAVAGMVARLVRDPALGSALGSSAQERASHYSVEAQGRAYETIYEAMISEARAR